MASLAQFAFNTVRDGISARAGLARMRAEDLKVRDATWFRMVGEVRAHYGNRIAEMSAPQNVAPRRDRVTPIPTKVQRGFRQYVDVWIKERGVDQPRMVTQAVITDRLLSRQAAVDRAVEGYRRAQARRQTTGSTTITPSDARVVGAIYTTELEFVPEREFAPE